MLGAGWVATEHISAFGKNPKTEVVAVCSSTPESAKRKIDEMKISADVCKTYEEMLERPDVDIVSIGTPNYLHYEEVMKASEAGKHIFIEKPAGLTVEQLWEMRDSVRESGVKTLVGFVLRWNPLFDVINSMIDDGVLGRIFYEETDYQHNIGDWARGWKWYGKDELGGGSLLGAGIHAVDALRWFAGDGLEKTSDIVEVHAYSGGYRHRAGDIDFDGLVVAIMKLENGVLAKVSSNWDCTMPYRFPIEVFGDMGTIKNNRVYSEKYRGQTDFMTIPTVLPDSGEVSHHPFEPEINHFVECIESNRESHCNLEDSINTHEACIAANISAETGKTIELPLS